jgi:Vanillate O-demethylase oxygenase C-terminal domain
LTPTAVLTALPSAREDEPRQTPLGGAAAGFEREPGALDFRWSNQMNLHIPIPNKLMMMLVACVPVDRQRTRMIMIVARDFLTSSLFDWFFHRVNLRIANEDKAIVESSFPAEVPKAGGEPSVRTDGPTLAFRKRYFAELHGSSRGAGASCRG